jgi:hypothetical protein
MTSMDGLVRFDRLTVARVRPTSIERVLDRISGQKKGLAPLRIAADLKNHEPL